MFYENFSFLCKKAGISESAAAEAIGIDKSAVTRWRNGATPKNTTIRLVAEYFGVSTEDMIEAGTEDSISIDRTDYGDVMEQLEMLHKNPKLRVLLSSGSKLDAKGIEAVINIIDQMNKE